MQKEQWSVNCKERRHKVWPFNGLCLYTDKFTLFFVFNKMGVKQLGSNAFVTGPDRDRKVQEIYRKSSGKVAGRDCATPKKYHDRKRLSVGL